MLIICPNVPTIDEERTGNKIRQIGELAPRFEGALATFTRGRLQGFLFRPADGDDVLILPKGGQIPDGYAQVLHATVDAQANRLDLSDGTWLRHPLIRDAEAVDHGQEIADVLDSWAEAFSYAEEDPSRDITGLRRPQIGAVRSICTGLFRTHPRPS